MSVADEVKQRVDIVEIISESVVLKKAGRHYKGLCPFHQERTPSFVVYPESQSWHCFGACGEGGDVFTFVQKMEGVEFGEALRILAQRAGMSLHPQTPEMIQEAEERDRLLELLDRAAAFFADHLRGPQGDSARQYLARRGVTEATADHFQLGYAPDSWRALITRMTAEGYTHQELVEAGLVVEREGDDPTRVGARAYDRFRNRLIIPIADARGRVVGFGARALDSSLPKYINSPQTRVFDKSRLLYGLDKARRAIVDAGFSVIVEGYLDVISLHQSGYRNVVASMGTAIGEPHLQALVRLAPRIVLALDADSAGSAATLRGLSVASEALQGEPSPSFDGGLLRFERKLEAEIRVAVLPEGKDPDEVVREDAGAWERLIQEARSLVDYNFEVALAEADLSDAKGKSRLARQLLPVIAAIPDPIERAHYIERLARHIQVDPDVVEQEISAMRRTRGRELQPPTADALRRGPAMSAEEYVLGFLLQSPDTLALVNGALENAGLERLEPADFLDAANRSLFSALLSVGASDRLALRSSLSPALRQRYDEVQRVWAQAPETAESVLTRDGVAACMRVRERRLRHQLRLLEQALREVETEEEERSFEAAIGKATRQVLLLTRAMAERSSLKAKT
ncbi:MAG: DNA primase [Anaerolineae bacterium]|nr:DNA primase [Anaerolineae bacterium]